MAGPLSRYLRNRSEQNPVSQELDMLKEAVRGRWDISDEKMERIKDRLVAIANGHHRMQAVKAARVIQQGIENDRKNQREWARLILEDEIVDEKIRQAREAAEAARSKPTVQVNQQFNEISLDQIHSILDRVAAPLPRIELEEEPPEDD